MNIKTYRRRSRLFIRICSFNNKRRTIMKYFSDRTTIDDSHRSQLNIKLKTHSLTSLEIPLETSAIGFHRIGQTFGNSRQWLMAGSVDQISEFGANRQRPTKFNDSVARLRRNADQFNGHYRSSLQTVKNLSERSNRHSLLNMSRLSLIDRSIPKFSLRPLPSFAEIRRHTSEKSVRSSSSWEKSRSWSWKSILRPSERNKTTQRQIENQSSQCPLPVIIESPTNRQSFVPKSSLSHSVSNYEVSSNILSIESKIRYPSTPLLSDFRSNRFLSAPLSTFDEIDEEEEEEDSTSIDSTFRSCLDSLQESSTLSASFTDELTSEYDLHFETLPNQQTKRTRSSFCLLQ